jgi:hypothetical protein
VTNVVIGSVVVQAIESGQFFDGNDQLTGRAALRSSTPRTIAGG